MSDSIHTGSPHADCTCGYSDAVAKAERILAGQPQPAAVDGADTLRSATIGPAGALPDIGPQDVGGRQRMTRLTLETPTRQGSFAPPSASIEVEQHDDGRWMWAFGLTTSDGGEGFAPFPKWGRFADTREAAIDAAIAEMRERLAQRCLPAPQVRTLLLWLDELRPPQGDLFGGAA